MHRAGADDSGLRWGAAGMQGWRTGMEDSHMVCLDLNGESSKEGRSGADASPAGEPVIAAFAVFDGHVRAQVLKFQSLRTLPIATLAPNAVYNVRRVVDLGARLSNLKNNVRTCRIGESMTKGPLKKHYFKNILVQHVIIQPCTSSGSKSFITSNHPASPIPLLVIRGCPRSQMKGHGTVEPSNSKVDEDCISLGEAYC